MSKDYFGPVEEDVEYKAINRYQDLTGRKFGRWTVNEKRGYHYLCECLCGFIAIREAYALLTLKTTQCYKCYRKNRMCHQGSLRIKIDGK